MRPVRINQRSLGVNVSSSGDSEVIVWAPKAQEVNLILADQLERIPLLRQTYGYFTCSTTKLKVGDRYFVEIDQSSRYPDPASLYQPDGIFGPSQVMSLHHSWKDTSWNNIPLKDYIFYELHVGTFSPTGTFDGIAEKLEYLAALGITAIELMPIAEFSGARNWGYDGVFPFATHHVYGGPTALQHLVDKCHEFGIAVVLDVVYNHMGPEGNNLAHFGPYFTDKYKTPWGSAINFDDAGSDEVRKFFVENVLMWFRDFHIDALRLDAVHAIRDLGSKHFLAEVREHVDNLMRETGRNYYLIAECDLNDPKYITPSSGGGYGMDAQWIDEFHHALRVSGGNEQNGYYEDFNGIAHLAKSFQDAYVYDGIYSSHRQKTFGQKATDISSHKFIVFSQNHDQVGNRMLGERTSELVSFSMQKLMAATVLLSPFLPFLFMGEEYGETNPFQYFVNHQDTELIAAVRNGRKEEFKAFHHGTDVPDPQSEQTFAHSKLQWDLLEQPKHSAMLDFYRELISIRKRLPSELLGKRDHIEIDMLEKENVLTVRRSHNGFSLITVYNYSSVERSIQSPFSLDGLKLVVNSSTDKWGNDNMESQNQGSTLLISPESFLLFTNYSV